MACHVIGMHYDDSNDQQRNGSSSDVSVNQFKTPILCDAPCLVEDNARQHDRHLGGITSFESMDTDANDLHFSTKGGSYDHEKSYKKTKGKAKSKDRGQKRREEHSQYIIARIEKYKGMYIAGLDLKDNTYLSVSEITELEINNSKKILDIFSKRQSDSNIDFANKDQALDSDICRILFSFHRSNVLLDLLC